MSPVEPPAPDTPIDSPPSRRSFPVVGIGASAGGLTPTTELLHALGPRPGLGIVVIHHLDPTHDSSLVGLLARDTPMPVVPASDGTPVVANHVYVIPPNAALAIVDGVLKVSPRLQGGLHLPIDHFFASLAQDLEDLAVGVVLSGTGSDGTAGLKAIREKGGITLAQDESAQYGDMPKHAIQTGCVDLVKAPAELAKELVRIGADPGQDFVRILATMTKASGVDFAKYKQSTLRRRMDRRIVARRLGGLREYADTLENDPTETAALCEEVLIHVTHFFRDMDAFVALKKLVLPKLLDGRSPDDPIRIWVPGCASGEEVYSIAMTVLEAIDEAGGGRPAVKLFGTDVSASSIDRARAAVYPESIEEHVTQGRRDRFFTHGAAGYQIRKDVRDLCVFAQHDATRDPPFSNMDLVSCRNVMIYLGPALQDRLVPLFHYALKEPGFLLLGPSETVRTFPGFSIVDEKNKIYARTSASPRYPVDFASTHVGEPLLVSAGPKPATVLDATREADRLVLAEYAPSGVVVTDDLAIVQFRGKVGGYIEPAPGAASLDLFRMAREGIRVPLRQAIDEARSTQGVARRKGLGPPESRFELAVVPFTASSRQRYFLILFEEEPKVDETLRQEAPGETVSSAAQTRVEQELDATRAYLQSVIEQLEAGNEELKAANEEIVSSNEELRSTNEELQTAKEELQASNEELRTVNEEMAERNAVASRVNDDLKNVLNSIDIPVVLLGRDARIRRFTPAAAKVFHVVATDVGRPLDDIKPILHVPELPILLRQALERLTVVTRTAQDEEGRWYEVVVRPYLTEDNRIDGTVVIALDVDAPKRAQALLLEASELSRNVIDTVRECLFVVDNDLRIRSANRAFRETFALTGELVGQPLVGLGHGEWNAEPLKAIVSDLSLGRTVDDLRVEHTFATAGWRVFSVSTRRIEHSSLMLVAMWDVTERERTEKALRSQELAFRELLMSAVEAILMFDETGQVIFANDMAAQVFGYPREELVGISAETLVPEALRGDHASHRKSFIDAKRSGKMGANRDVYGVRKDGSTFPAEVALGWAEHDKRPLVVSFITDMSDRRAAEKEIREYQEKLQQMAFDAAVGEERERRRIAVDLHDRIGQSLALVQIKLGTLRDGLPVSTKAGFDDTIALLDQCIVDTRNLTFDLTPPVLYDLGLGAALSWLAEDLEKRHGIRIDLEDVGELPVDDATAGLLFRAVREVLMNVLKHAKTTRAKVAVHQIDGKVAIDVEDSGVGFSPNDPTFRTATSGFGLFSVREQLSRLGGTLELTTAPGQGTKVSLVVPTRPPSRSTL